MSHTVQDETNSHSNQRIEYLEGELLLKDKKLELLQEKWMTTSKEIRQMKIELSAAKSYINTLPTQQEVLKLKNILSSLKEQKEQRDHDFLKLEGVNSRLHFQLSAMQQEVAEYKTALENKSGEVDALQFTIKLWEKRRKEAQQAGQVTVEDVIADKMRIQEQLEDTLKIASCREQYLKARIDKMKVKVEEERCVLEEVKTKNTLLRIEIEKLEQESNENKKNCSLLQESNNRLEEQLVLMSAELQHLKSRENFRRKTIEIMKKSIAGVSKCQQEITNITIFIQDAIKNKHLNPELLFPSCDTDSIDVAGCETEETLEKSAQQWMDEIISLNKQVTACQQIIIGMYVSKLSLDEGNQCLVQ